MDTQRWQLTRDLFDAVVDLPHTQWETQLAALCPNDETVRADVLALVRADDEFRRPVAAGTG